MNRYKTVTFGSVILFASITVFSLFHRQKDAMAHERWVVTVRASTPESVIENQHDFAALCNASVSFGLKEIQEEVSKSTQKRVYQGEIGNVVDVQITIHLKNEPSVSTNNLEVGVKYSYPRQNNDAILGHQKITTVLKNILAVQAEQMPDGHHS